MTRFILAALATLLVSGLFVLAQTARGLIARLVRTALFLITLAVGLIGLGTGISALEKGTWAVAVVGGVVALLAFRFAWALSRGPRQARQWAERPQPTEPAPADPNSPWDQFEAGLDWVARKQVRRAHASIEAFMAERDSSSMNQRHRDLLVTCEKRVPELIETCIGRCRRATARERDRYIDETLDRLAKIGDEAEQARREVREADDRQLETLHRYFDTVAPRDDRPDTKA